MTTGTIERGARVGTEAPLAFTLPPSLEAYEPPEARGIARDGVRLMVSFLDDDSIVHTRFTTLPDLLRRGDVLVVNTSATINAALEAVRPSGERVRLHLSQRLPSGNWVIELRRLAARATVPLFDAMPGERLELETGGAVVLLAPYGDGIRLWIAALEVAGDFMRYLDRHGAPIRYGYVPERWPLSYYQTMFARERGSAEMPSAGRAFTPRVVERLERAGVSIVPILLHTGVASLENHEAPYPELYRVSEDTARTVTDAARRGGRIVAVGTTVVRALESAADPDGSVRSSEGWTDLVITPERGLYAVDALLTGLHEPRASHLAILEALAGRERLEAAYEAALRERYLWHEFGDLHLILPR